MSTIATKTCRRCGAKLFGDARVCSACMLETALGVLVDDDLDASAGIRTRVAGDDRRSWQSAMKNFGEYELLEEIGRGGQGVVYRARQKSLNRTVALKVIGLGQWATEAHLKRFRLEAEAAASLEHPGIVPIHEVGERDGSCYFSMKFIEGGQLDEVVKLEPMPIRCAVELIAKVARTVHYAHEHGILHRDIKPGNILLDKEGEPHLTDFGLARLVESESSVTHTLDVLGTPSYMAPEQAVGNNAAISSATDVYGLGAVLYQLLTGHPPFAGGTTYETIKLVLDTEPRQPRAWNPKIDRDLSTICLKCLDKDPKRRYPSALALAEDLEYWLKHEPIRARRAGVFTRGRKWVRRNPSMAAMMALLLALAVPLGVLIWKTEIQQLPVSNLAAPEKSIAVLPFSNLSKEPENAFFADGVQDEILTDLARIADLKVISRTSVMHYKSPAPAGRNLREIGQQLGVANVLEGSVQRSGNRVRVNAQLVDARTDKHLWAKTYDRDLADVFAVQSEIAKTIADQLQARLSPGEEKAIERAPTSDLVAFGLYTRAKNLLATTSDRPKAELLQAVDLLNQAVARDPSFFDAYCQLANAHDWLYFYGWDHTPPRLAQAEAAIQAAARLRPDAGETHLARAVNLYWGYRNYEGALAELAAASRTLPNDAQLFQVKSWIVRRQGRWAEGIRDLEHAIELDPYNVHLLRGASETYWFHLRRYADGEALLDRISALAPDNLEAKLIRGYMEADWKADLRPAIQVIEKIRSTNPAWLSSIADYCLWVALVQRDAVAAEDALTALGNNPIGNLGEIIFNHAFIEGVIARMTKDDAKARSAFAAARAEQEKIVQAQPDDSRALCALALIDAGLGRKEDALREGRRAVELLPLEKDALTGVYLMQYLGLIEAWVGDKDLAFEQLETVVRLPGSGLAYGDFKLNPWWDPLRGDPRFEKLMEEAKQPVELEPVTQSAPEKSIAVLPFQNLSRDPDNAFFADGVQDEILTDLARIADLKVISRTSVMHYKSGTARNLREIGQQLGVANVVEGSVQRSGNRVRVNAQLVDARTDRHLWGQTYDRDLADVFAIQSEIAKTIADQLQARLSLAEEKAIERAPTSDLAAFDLYTRAKNILLEENHRTKAELLGAVDLLNQAVARDPAFFDAYCQLAYVHDAIYFFSHDHTAARLALAEAAIQAAARLDSNAGETHLARARSLYWGYLDYDGALAELEVARQTLPNDFRVPTLMAQIQRRRGRWEESTRSYERAAELNPRYMVPRAGIAYNYTLLRRYADVKSAVASTLAVFPNDLKMRMWPTYVEFHVKADTRPLHQMLDSILATNPTRTQDIARWWLTCALAERDAIAAKNALDAYTENRIDWDHEVSLSRSFVESLIARMTKDEDKARSALVAARAEQQEILQAQPNDSRALGLLGLIDAYLGRKEEALREGRRAVELMPVEKDALVGVDLVANLAIIGAWVGDKDLAFEQLESIIHRPSFVSYAELKLFPWWDPLRDDSRFEKILEEAKQPIAVETARAPEESIAVLPFENLSDDKEHALFADGVQDDILTKLAKIADLKVISRTSVMQYRGKQNAREIGDALRVSHVLEGSLRRDRARIHLNAQLIDTRTDTHVWAEQYDRDLGDMFAIQSEIAQKVAGQLQAKISAREKTAIAERPTKDLVAYDRYVQAASLIDNADRLWGVEQNRKYFQAIELLDQAIARDPSFLLAYCRLASAHDELYFQNGDHTPGRLALAQAAIDSAFRLKPDSGEAHLALAAHVYQGYFDYDRARDELAIAVRTLPNDARIFEWSGSIDRRQGRWHDAVRDHERAMELDPRNVKILTSAAMTYNRLRQYARERAIIDRLIALEPNYIYHRGRRALIDFQERADTRPWHVFDKTVADPKHCPECALSLALYERNTIDADHALAEEKADTFGVDIIGGGGMEFSRAYFEGLVARMKGDGVAAQAAFSAARTQQEEAARTRPDYGPTLCVLGMIDAALGRKEEALREGRQALELAPIAKDSLQGADVLYFYAVICAWTGERDLAIEQLETLAKIPAGVFYGDLRLNPYWDTLRGDPRFEKIVASLAPKG